MKTFEDIVWTKDNLVPILKKAHDEYYGDPLRRGVTNLFTYCGKKCFKGVDGKKHAASYLWCDGTEVHLNCNTDKNICSIRYKFLSEDEKDELIAILNDSTLREKAIAAQKEYAQKLKAFTKEYDALCEKYHIRMVCGDPYEEVYPEGY